jgi:hypothetical protein
MKYGSKILGMLLSAALVTAALPAGALVLAVADHAPSAALGERPAGCHAHGGQSLPLSQMPHSPLPAPASYQCCLTGHDAAVVPASTSPQPPSAPVPPQIESLLTGLFLGGLEVSMIPSAEPPGTTPLRI